MGYDCHWWILMNVIGPSLALVFFWGMAHLCGGGARSGHWSWSSEIRAVSVNAMCVRNWKPSYFDVLNKFSRFLLVQTSSFDWCVVTVHDVSDSVCDSLSFLCGEMREWGVKVSRQRPAHGYQAGCTTIVPEAPRWPIRRQVRVLEYQGHISWANV